MADFKRSLAVVIGINEYQDYSKLQTARYDAERLAEILAIEHKYDYVILVADETYKEYLKGQELPVKTKYQPTLNGLLDLLDKRLPAEIKPTQEDRLLFYFAGHGIPDDSDEGPKGYLVPLDADRKKRDSLLPMQELYKYLAALNCRHFLIILDCCFAGRFRWESNRKGRTFPKVIHKEHYERFINSTAWQAITSASHDQKAYDTLCDNRETVEGTNHSPFAQGLFKALQGEADVNPPSKKGQPPGDGVITATELYMYLEDYVAKASKGRQTPGKWDLPKHDRGEYIFLAPGAELKLKPAPRVNEKNNPYRGLKSFDEEHSRFFFGREELIQQLSERISAPTQPLTVVFGVSGSGKSSLVKAGLIPRLNNPSKSEKSQANPVNTIHQWRILKSMRPGEHPFTSLAKAILPLADVTDSNQPDTLDFIKVSDRLDELDFMTEFLKHKVEYLDVELDESSHNTGEKSSETLRLKEEVDKFESISKEWNQGSPKAKQLLIVEHFEELYALCQKKEEKQQFNQPSPEQQQLQQAVSDCLDPLSKSLQSNPKQLINIVKVWSQKNPGVRLLLTIDQFEELITLSQSKQKDKQNNQQQQRKKLSNQPTPEVQQENKQEEWQQFLSLLEQALSANVEQLRIIVTLRSDFEPRFSNEEALKSHWKQALFPVKGMEPDELREAIERPASEMALYFEPPTLVDELMAKVGQMPGTLPLLSFILSELYIKLAEKWRLQEKSDRALTLDADFDTGEGLIGLLTKRANQEYNNLPDDAHKDTLRRVMLRMVTTEGGELARRRVSWSELEYADKEENDRVDLVLKRFIDHARLIVRDGDYVEPAHDFLVKNWGKLQQWQQNEQQNLLLQRQLTPVAIAWKSKEQSSSWLGKTEPFGDWCHKRIDSVVYLWNEITKKDTQERRRERKGQFLWNGNPYLDVLKNRLKVYDHWFNQVETEFVQKSVWRRRRNVCGRRLFLTVVILGLSGLTIWALIGQKQARIEQVNADKNSTETQLRTNQPTLEALMSSIRAGKSLKNLNGFRFRLISSLPWLKWPDQQWENQVITTLRRAVYQVKELNRWQLPQGEVQDAFLRQDGTLLMVMTIKEKDNDSSISLWDSSTRQVKPLIPVVEGKASFSPDGSKLAIGGKDGSIHFWDVASQQLDEEEFPKFPGSIESVTFSPTGRLLGLIIKQENQQSAAYLLNLQSKQWKELPKFSDNPKITVKYIRFINGDNPVGVFTREYTETRKSPSETCNNCTFYDAIFWDYSAKKMLFKKEVLSNYDAKLSFDGQKAAVINYYKLCSIYLGIESEKPIEDKNQKEVVACKGNFSPNGNQFAVAGGNGIIYLYDVQNNSSQELVEWNAHNGRIASIKFTIDGKQLITTSEDGTIRLWDLENPPLTPIELSVNQTIKSASLSPDGQKIIIIDSQENGSWLDSSKPNLVHPLPGNPSGLISTAFSPDSKHFAIANKDNTISVRNFLGKLMFSPPFKLPQDSSSENNEEEGKKIDMTFKSDGGLFAISGYENSGGNKIYQVLQKKQATINLHPVPINLDPNESLLGLTFNLDGNLLVVTKDMVPSNKDCAGCIYLSDSLGNKIKTLGESRDNINIAINIYGSLMAIAESNNIIKVLDILNNQQIMQFQAYEDAKDKNEIECSIKSMSLSADGSILAVVGKDGKVHLWQLGGLDELLQRGCERARDYLATLENNSDRYLCDNIPPITPSQQTAVANSSTIVQSPAQNVPSPTPPSNNGQNSDEQALSDRNQANKLNSVDVYINQGLTYHRQRNYQQAISNYSQALALNPNSDKAYSNRAAAYNEQKDYPKAIADSSKAISLNPTYANAYINRGVAYHHQGNSQQAIADYTKAIKLAPGNANAYNNRALAYTRLGNQQAAQADKRKAAVLSQ